MGLFDSVAGQVLGAVTGQQQSAGALGAISDLVQQSGGVSGLLKNFEAQGLGGAAASWIGTGENQAVTAAQIAQHLPKVIDMLTPNGKVPEAGGLAGALGGILGSLKG